MDILSMVVAMVVLGFLYKRMIDRDTLGPVSVWQALVPVGLGVASLLLSFPITLGAAVLLQKLGYVREANPLWVQSVVAAFAVAGLPEELAKFVMILLSLLIFRSKIKNVYEYVLIGAGVGIGFTIFEEYLYGSSLASMIFRLFLIALHMLFGMIMAWYLGKARYQKLTGEGSPAVSRLLAFLIPIALHTLYDACTGTSAFLSAENEDLLMTGIIIGLVGTVVMFALQIFMLLRCKKKAEALSLMTF